MSKDQKRTVFTAILSWVDTLPPPLPYTRGVYWRVYKVLPFIVGIMFTITGLLELVYSHSVHLVLMTAIWYVGVFFLIALFMVSRK